MRSKLVLAVTAVALLVSAQAKSSELIGGGYYEQKNVGGAMIPLRSETWFYGTPAATTPDQIGRPAARGPSTRQDVGYNPSEEARKKAIRDKSGYRDPPGTRELR